MSRKPKHQASKKMRDSFRELVTGNQNTQIPPDVTDDMADHLLRTIIDVCKEHGLDSSSLAHSLAEPTGDLPPENKLH